jgi:hypothetical protein
VEVAPVVLHTSLQVLVVAAAVKLQAVREVLSQTRRTPCLSVEVERPQQEALPLEETVFGQELQRLVTSLLPLALVEVVDHLLLPAAVVVLHLPVDLPVVVVVLGHRHHQLDRLAQAEPRLRVAMLSRIAPMKTCRLVAVAVVQAVRVLPHQVAQVA